MDSTEFFFSLDSISPAVHQFKGQTAFPETSLAHRPTRCFPQSVGECFGGCEQQFLETSGVASATVMSISGTMTTTKRRPMGGVVVKPSRWKRDKSKMGGLEQQLVQQQQRAKQLEQEGQKLRLRNVALEHTIASRDWQLGVLGRRSEERRQTTTAALTAASREFVSNASLLLLKLSDTCSAATDQPILSRISDLVSELLHVVGGAYVLNPGVHFTLIAAHLEAAPNALESRACARADERHWEQVARKISVTPEQLEEITACWNLTNEAMAWLQDQAAELHKELGMAVEQNQSCKLMDIVNRLSALDMKQGVLYRGFCFAIFFRIMSPFHLARTMVHSFPYYIDTKELVRKLMHIHGVA